MRFGFGLMVLAAVSLAGCGSDGGPAAGEDGGPDMDAGPGPDAGPVTDSGTDTDAGSDSGSDSGTDTDAGTGSDSGTDTDAGIMHRVVSCSDEPPAGADLPAEPPSYSGGSCPDLSPGTNTITSDGNAREVIVVAPEGYDGSEPLPLVFLWHWLGGDAEGFVERAFAQEAANEKNILIVSMEAKGDLDFKWPYATGDSGCLPVACDFEERIEEELTYFDDVLACMTEQYNVNPSCVSSVGVSAGALWTGQLAPRRSEHLASIVSLSGGTGGLEVRPWEGADHHMPAIVLWGGPDDWCGLSFEDASKRLETGLQADDHFILECIHNCGHSVPPFDPPDDATKFSVLWDFVVDHPYWLRDGESPWAATGLPDTAPGWCAIGKDSATIRTGECGPDECM